MKSALHRKVTRSCKVQNLSKNNLKGSQFYLDRSIYVVFLLSLAKIYARLPKKIKRILPGKLIRFVVFSKNRPLYQRNDYKNVFETLNKLETVGGNSLINISVGTFKAL